MTDQYLYDPDDWLVSATRALATYIDITLDDPDVTVEEDFPDTRSWAQSIPLPKSIVHVAQDVIDSPPLGFGRPGVEIVDDIDGTVTIQEASLHQINYDVGVWCSAEGGGATKRMQLTQALKDMFTVAGQKLAFQEATSGITVVSFDGGRNALDRVNDLPLWRTLDMTLIVKVISRFIVAPAGTLVTAIVQEQDLSITDSSGHDEPL